MRCGCRGRDVIAWRGAGVGIMICVCRREWSVTVRCAHAAAAVPHEFGRDISRGIYKWIVLRHVTNFVYMLVELV